MTAARGGDDAAFAVLIERHDPMLRLLTHHLLDGEGIDAALIDAYVKAYRGLGRQRGDALPVAHPDHLSRLPRPGAPP